MKSFLALLISITFFLSSCSTTTYKEGTEDPYNTALNKAFSELKEKQKRGMASQSQSASPVLRKLRMRPEKLGSFKMLVFPTDLNMHLKRTLKNPNKFSYGQPQTFVFKTLKKGLCRHLKRSKKYGADIFFKNGIFGTGQSCVIIEGRRQRPRKWGKVVTRLRRDDMLAVRLYFDDHFRPFGKSLDYVVKQGTEKYRTVHMKYDEKESMSSEMGLFPIDLPNFRNSQIKKSFKYVKKGAIRLPSDFFVAAKIKSRAGKSICKTGYQVNYSDQFGNNVAVDFCKGKSWPTAIHTMRFFAILI